jgi:hypothetical protein
MGTNFVLTAHIRVKQREANTQARRRRAGGGEDDGDGDVLNYIGFASRDPGKKRADIRYRCFEPVFMGNTPECQSFHGSPPPHRHRGFTDLLPARSGTAWTMAPSTKVFAATKASRADIPRARPAARAAEMQHPVPWTA